MARAWHLKSRPQGLPTKDNFELREFELPDLASVEELIRSIEPVSHVSSPYMEVSGLGAFLRIGTLPLEPLDELLRRALEELLSHQGSTGLATTFLSRAEILERIPARGETGLTSTNGV